MLGKKKLEFGVRRNYMGKLDVRLCQNLRYRMFGSAGFVGTIEWSGRLRRDDI